MKRLLSFLLAFAVVCPVFAADSTSKGGFIEYNRTNGVYTDMVVNGTLRAETDVDETSTNDTLVNSTDQGKTIVITGDNTIINLDGLETGVSNKVVAGGAYSFTVNPEDSDKFLYSTFGFADGQSIASTAGATSDFIEFVGVTDGWLVIDTNGTIAQGS